VTLPPQTITARLAEGAQAAAPALVAKVVVTQTLDGDPGAVKVGDALTRTLETFAANTQAMMIPPPRFQAPEGVRLYPRDPVLNDVKTDRGDVTGGRRIDQVTYIFEEPGLYTLPAIEIGWVNADSGKRQVATAPAIRVSVAPAPAPPPNPPRIAYGSAHLLGCLASSLPRLRASGAGADSDRACGRGDRRAVRPGRPPSARHLRGSSAPVGPAMRPVPIVSLGSGLGAKA
jgi:hypothetical protein